VVRYFGHTDRVKHLLVVLAILLLSTDLASAGKETVDLVQFTPPAAYKKMAWEKVHKKDVKQTYTMVDKEAGTYCQIGVYYSVASTGDLDAEFTREWAIFETYNVKPAQVTEPREENGWMIKAGVAEFEFNGKPAYATLTTFSGYGRTTSIAAVMSSDAFFPVIEKFLGSVLVKKPATAKAAATKSAPSPGAGGGKAKVAEQYMEYNTMLKQWVWKWRYPK
jgi:hypothetical protein